MLTLDDLPARCFQGVIPAVIATAAGDGTPNVTYLSQVFRVDSNRVALSCQFFNKTKENVLANPRATLELYDPVTFEAYRIELGFDHEERSGPLFEAIRQRIDAIASHTGMAGIFRLLSADLYDVLAVERREEFLVQSPAEPCPAEDPSMGSHGELGGLQLVSRRACQAESLEQLVSSVLEALDEAFGFRHCMLLVPDDSGERLWTLASRGYPNEGAGAEIAFGEGLVGTVARERCILRMSGVEAELRYGRAIRSSVQRTEGRRDLCPEIPLPGLCDAQSALAMPLVVGDRLLGVLAVESAQPLAFEEWHEAYLGIVAGQVALAMDALLLREREGVDGHPAAEDSLMPTPPTRAERPARAGVRRFRYYAGDDSVFVDDEYLIRNLPGRILWLLLEEHVASGRVDFTNRELRADGRLGLPAYRDNLESRLVLLRKRLQLRCPELRLAPTGRGRFRIERDCEVQLERR